MGSKMTPSQQVAGFAATLAFCFATTAIMLRWPEYSDWVFGGGLVLIAIFLFFVYMAARKETPPDVEE